MHKRPACLPRAKRLFFAPHVFFLAAVFFSCPPAHGEPARPGLDPGQGADGGGVTAGPLQEGGAADAGGGSPQVAEDVTAQKLPRVLVTAQPILESNELDAHGFASAVVGRAQIVELNAFDVGSALRTVPGVSIARRNIAGSYGGGGGGAFYIRGMGLSRPGGEITTLYDGVPRVGAVFSHPLLDLLSMDSADSVRVLKSPQPHEFGNAFAAIAIEPRHAPAGFLSTPWGTPPADGVGGEIAAAYGTNDTVVESAVAHLRNGGTELSLGQSFRRSAGHRPNSGGELQDYFAHASQRLSPNWTGSLTFDHTDNRAEDPGGEGAETRMGDYSTHDYMTVLTLANRFEDARGHIKFYWHNGAALWLDQNPSGAGTATRDTAMRWDSYGIRMREVITPVEGGEVTAGLDYDVQSGKMTFSRNDGTAGNPYRRDEFQIYSPYAAISQIFGETKGFHVIPSAGLRFYAHNHFGSATAPHASLVLGHGDRTRVHFTASRGVNYPGMNVAIFAQNTIPTIAATTAGRRSWHTLRSEALRHFEVGVSRRFHEILQGSLTGFYDESRHRYVMGPNSGTSGPPQRFLNGPGYCVRGVEAVLSCNPADDLSLFAGGTWLDSSVEGLPYAPEWSASAGFSWKFLRHFRLGVDLSYQDTMRISEGFGRVVTAYGAAASNRRVPAILLLNARLSYAFTLHAARLRQCEVFLAGENLLDRTYYYGADGTGKLYPMPGAGVLLGLRATF
ncbi:MAG: TonB-dependent receptor plug domain-containing protein [Puniceicoccales bacterium]|nr:TonB-dependent receptor plug domain-containing protein [Puniceicoccales bacterium]